MPRKLLRRYLPAETELDRHWLLWRLHAQLRKYRLWSLTRRSVARATGVGLFVAFLPVPQTVTIVLLCILLRVNLLVALAMIFVTNPLTMAPAFYVNYLVGTRVLRIPPIDAPDDLSLQWVLDQLGAIWLPLYTGSLVVGSALGLLGMLGVDLVWQIQVRRQRRRKAHLRQ